MNHATAKRNKNDRKSWGDYKKKPSVKYMKGDWIWLFYLSLLAILGLILGYSWRYGISPTPTSEKVKNELIKILPSVNGVIAELGSGWGTLAFALAHHYPSNSIYAYEISPIPFYISKFIHLFLSYKNLIIKRCDFFTISLNDASLVVCYLYPEGMTLLKKKFEEELNPNAYVLSHTFAVPGWKPIQNVIANDLYRTPIYLYQMKLR